MENMQNMGGKNICKCPHHKVMPVLIILFGLDFLLGALGWLSLDMVDIIWPVLIITAGVFKMMKGKCTCCSSPH